MDMKYGRTEKKGMETDRERAMRKRLAKANADNDRLTLLLADKDRALTIKIGIIAARDLQLRSLQAKIDRLETVG